MALALAALTGVTLAGCGPAADAGAATSPAAPTEAASGATANEAGSAPTDAASSTTTVLPSVSEESLLADLQGAPRGRWGQPLQVSTSDGAGVITVVSATWKDGPIGSYASPQRGHFLILKVTARATRGVLSPADLVLRSPDLHGDDGATGDWRQSGIGGDAMDAVDGGADDLLDVRPGDGLVHGYAVFDLPTTALHRGYLVWLPRVAYWDLAGMPSGEPSTAPAAGVPAWAPCSKGTPVYARAGATAAFAVCTGYEGATVIEYRSGSRTVLMGLLAKNPLSGGANACGITADATSFTLDCGGGDTTTTTVTRSWQGPAWDTLQVG